MNSHSCCCDTNSGRDFRTQVVIVEELTAEAILGADFLAANECEWNAGEFLLILWVEERLVSIFEVL